MNHRTANTALERLLVTRAGRGGTGARTEPEELAPVWRRQMPKRYGVTMPLVGKVYLEVEADNEEEAIRKAADEAMNDDIEDWDVVARQA